MNPLRVYSSELCSGVSEQIQKCFFLTDRRIFRSSASESFNCYRVLVIIMMLVSVTPAARFALLIGNANGGSDVTTLKFVDNDLRVVKSVLTDYCGFLREHIVSITGKGPSDVIAALDRLSQLLPGGEENLLLLYYTGHADQDHLKMGDRRLSVAEMKNRFSSFPAAIRIGVFDACQSGSFTRLKGGALAEPFLFKDTEKIKGEVILASSSPTESAQESDLYGNSIFTFHFVNALRGSGDASGDGKVTLSEAYQYSYNHTVSSTARTWGGVQHPSYQFRIQGEGDVVLADLTLGTTGIILEGGMAGDVSIFDSLNNIVADLTKEHGSRMIIALNAGRYQIVTGGTNTQKWSTNMIVHTKSLVPVRMADFRKIESVPVLRKGASYERFRIGFAAAGVYGSFDFSSYADDLGDAFAGFSRFGIDPVFIDSAGGPRPSIGLYIRIRERYTGSFGYSWLQRETTKQYPGSFREVGDMREYPISLDQEERLYLGIFDWGLGLQCPLKYLGLTLQGGACLVSLDVALRSSLSDKLYDAGSSVDYRDHGVMVLPWIAGGYSYVFFHNVDVGLQVRYRYQGAPKRLSAFFSTSSAAGDAFRPRYNLGGIDVSLSVGVCLISRGGGE